MYRPATPSEARVLRTQSRAPAEERMGEVEMGEGGEGRERGERENSDGGGAASAPPLFRPPLNLFSLPLFFHKLTVDGVGGRLGLEADLDGVKGVADHGDGDAAYW